VLIYANKQDLPNVMKVDEIANKLRVKSFGNRQWYIQSCSASTGEGIYEGLSALNSMLSKSS